jgi:hypothetical protein
VELNGTVSQHRFAELDSDTYYTFTIILIAGPTHAEAESDSEAINVGFASRRTKLTSKHHCFCFKTNLNLFFLARSQILTLKRYGTRELLLTVCQSPINFVACLMNQQLCN